MKKNNNKGFSLVELIIVIAIMAILIGILAPQYIKYVEKSRVSADKDLLDAVYGACTTAAADPDITDGPRVQNTFTNIETVMESTTSWAQEVRDTLKVSDYDAVKNKLKSKACKNKDIEYTLDSKDNFVIKCDIYSIPER